MKKKTFYIIGKHSVEEAIKNPSRKIHKLYVTDDAKRRINQAIKNHNLLKNVKIFFRSKKELDNICGKSDLSHQGYVAEVDDIDQISLKEFIKKNIKDNVNLIALDEVTDPRNIGAIFRSAASFNIDGIIVKERSFPSDSKVLYKSASGAIEHIPVFKVSNINTAIRYLKEKDFWVSAFDSRSEKDFTENNWKGKNVLVFGSEGYGLKKNTLDNSDFKFKIKINKKIESLNISNAVSIVCHYISLKLKN